MIHNSSDVFFYCIPTSWNFVTCYIIEDVVELVKHNFYVCRPDRIERFNAKSEISEQEKEEKGKVQEMKIRTWKK